jgi:ribosomal protein L34E
VQETKSSVQHFERCQEERHHCAICKSIIDKIIAPSNNVQQKYRRKATSNITCTFASDVIFVIIIAL